MSTSGGAGGHAANAAEPAGRAVGSRDPSWVVEAAAGPLAAVDHAVPDDVPAVELSSYCLMLGDDALILAQRLTQWCHRAPGLAEDATLARIVVDLLEQARVLFERSVRVEGAGRDVDEQIRRRPAEEFRNVRLVEIDCGPGAGGSFAAVVAQLLVTAAWRVAVFRRLERTRDPVFAALARSSARALRAHRDHAVHWTIRLGDGAARERMLAGLQRVWPMTGELFVPHPVELRLAEADYAVDPSLVRDEVFECLDEVLSMARLGAVDPRVFDAPSYGGGHGATARRHCGGRDGVHTASLQFLLAEMRYTVSAGAAPGEI